MFGLFGKKKPEPPPVTVWMNSDVKFQAIADVVKANRATVVVAHFPETLRRVKKIFSEKNIAVEILSLGKVFGMSTFLKEAKARQATLALSDVFPSNPPAATNEKFAIDAIAAELYPTPERDALLQAQFQPFGVSLRYHVALNDALMKRFGSDQIVKTLKQLGGSETDPIEHELIARSLLEAQQKVKAGTIGDAKAESAADWLKKNFPETRS